MNINIRLWNRIKVLMTLGLCVLMVVMFYYVKKFEYIEEYFYFSLFIVAIILFEYYLYDRFYKKCEVNKEEYIRIDITTRLKFLATFSGIFIVLLLYLFEFNTVMLGLIKVAMYTLLMIDPGYYVIKDTSKYKARATQIISCKTIFAHDFGFTTITLIYMISVSLIHVHYLGYCFGHIASLCFLSFAEESLVKSKSKEVIIINDRNENLIYEEKQAK